MVTVAFVVVVGLLVSVAAPVGDLPMAATREDGEKDMMKVDGLSGVGTLWIVLCVKMGGCAKDRSWEVLGQN